MKKIEAKELTKILKKNYSKNICWIGFTDNVMFELIELGYARKDALEDFETDDYDYIWAQIENYWKVFCKRKD